MTEQQVFTVEDSPKQSKPDLPNNEVPNNFLNEPSSSTSTNKLTNSLKRSFPDEADSDKIKIIKSGLCNSSTNNSKKVDVCSDDIEVIDSVTCSDISLSNLSDLPEDINKIQFDSYLTQKIIEIMNKKLYWSKYHSKLQLLKKREKYWRSKFCSLQRQFNELKDTINLHKLDLKNNKFAGPHIATRTVGLQVVSSPKKEGSMEVPKVIPLPKLDNDLVTIIIDDDDDNVVMLDTEESDSSSTSIIANTTTKKQLSPFVTTSKLRNNKTKNVTAVKSLNPINIDNTPIDLTEDDDVIENPIIINLVDTILPIKIHHQSPAANLPELNRNLSNTCVEQPNNQSCSSSSIIRTASGSRQGITVSNEDTRNASLESKNLKPI